MQQQNPFKKLVYLHKETPKDLKLEILLKLKKINKVFVSGRNQ